MTKELEYPGRVERGDRGKKARQIQEWLSLNNHQVAVDGIFGPASEAALKNFQQMRELPTTGALSQPTFSALIRPMQRALLPPQNRPAKLETAFLRLARQHLAQHPREMGGQNRGPWVRLYMDGHEGNDWPWCAGFVCYVLKQACELLDVPMPFPKTYSCDILAAQGKERGLFVSEKNASKDSSLVGPGTIFLNRRTSTDWTHTGIVMSVESDEVFTTIEGNTNDEGSREGYEVCKRTRGRGKIDFVNLTRDTA